jgi:hypothetical protein
VTVTTPDAPFVLHELSMTYKQALREEISKKPFVVSLSNHNDVNIIKGFENPL